MSHVWENSPSKGNHRLMLLAIADMSNDVGDAFPGIPRLAKKCQISTRRAQQIVNDLERAGELQVFEKVGVKTRNGWTNLYRIVVPDTIVPQVRDQSGVIVTARTPNEPIKREFPSAKRASQVQPVSPQEVQPVSPQEVQPVSPESLVHPKGETKESRPSSKRSQSKKDYTAHDELINAWASGMGYSGASIGATFISNARRVLAAQMLTWDIPVTPDEVRRVVRDKGASNRNYDFRYLVTDIPLHRATSQRPITRPDLYGYEPPEPELLEPLGGRYE